MKSYLLPFAVLLLGAAPADAAALKLGTYGCRTEADAGKAATLQAHNDTAALDAFVKPKMTSGECLSFGRGLSVEPEQTKGGLTCARLAGGLECYWMADQLIDRHPPEGGRGAGEPGERRRR